MMSTRRMKPCHQGASTAMLCPQPAETSASYSEIQVAWVTPQPVAGVWMEKTLLRTESNHGRMGAPGWFQEVNDRTPLLYATWCQNWSLKDFILWMRTIAQKWVFCTLQLSGKPKSSHEVQASRTEEEVIIMGWNHQWWLWVLPILTSRQRTLKLLSLVRERGRMATDNWNWLERIKWALQNTETQPLALRNYWQDNMKMDILKSKG